MRKKKKKWNYTRIARYWSSHNVLKEIYDSIFYEDDLIDRNIGKWFVMKRVEYKKWRRCYLCKCKCGKEAIVVGEALRNGKTHGCTSCAAKQRWKDRKIKAIQERKYKKLNKIIEQNEENSAFFREYPDE